MKPPDRSEEFEQTAMPHTDALLRVARRMTGSTPAAEDAVQETLLSAWRSFHLFERGTNCKAWLFKILLNHLHKTHARPALHIVTLPEATPLENVIPIRSSFHELGTSDTIAVIESLTADHRIVLLLAALEGFTCKEISTMLGVPLGTVMSRLSRARADLRNILQTTSKGATA